MILFLLNLLAFPIKQSHFLPVLQTIALTFYFDRIAMIQDQILVFIRHGP